MAAATTESISVLVGPTCSACASDDLRIGRPANGVLPIECRGCATEYRWYEVPQVAAVTAGSDTSTECRFCGCLFDPDNDCDEPLFCHDCELSDCVYCGTPTNRPLLSENLACSLCELGDVA